MSAKKFLPSPVNSLRSFPNITAANVADGSKADTWRLQFPMSALPPKADITAEALAEHPSAITDDLVARASGITGVAQRQPSGLQVAVVRFDKKASDRQVAARLPGAQTGPVTIFYGRSGRRIQAPRGLITVIVRQVGA